MVSSLTRENRFKSHFAVDSNKGTHQMKMGKLGKGDRENTQKLVAEVQKRPVLYDTRHPAYKHKVKTDEEWEAVATAMGLPADVVKKRWQNLRGSYSKSLSAATRQGFPPPNGGFYLHNEMAFLQEHMFHNPVTDVWKVEMMDSSGYQEANSDQPAPESSPFRCPSPTVSCSSSSASETISKKRKLDFTDDSLNSFSESSQMQSQFTQDPDLEYFRGLLPHVKELTKRRKRDFFQQVTNILFSSLNEQEETSS